MPSIKDAIVGYLMILGTVITLMHVFDNLVKSTKPIQPTKTFREITYEDL
jgi:hypothetical protein